MEYKLQLKTEEWKIKRFSILKRDNFKCKKCGEKNNLHVHHKFYEKGLKPWAGLVKPKNYSKWKN